MLRALILCLLFSGALLAQDYRAKIQGIVTDSSQAVVAGASVTLRNVNTGVSTLRQTNETGRYLFDYVEPGSYTLTVEVPGFSKFVQENIDVQSRGDITVNAVLKPGAVQDSITVIESPVAVQFNSTNVTLTIDTKLATELPRFDRNPFKLSLLNPAAVNTRGEMMPYHSWAANSIELGGGTNLKNDLQVDGSPIGVGHKASYTPPPDSVQEVNILQNSIDAEAGHSAGGVISMSMKSGANEVHGDVFYLGRNPKLNAVTDRTILSNVAARNNMWGGQAGHPILKNRLFNFAAFEQWKLREPLNYLRTMPTGLQRQGDFSQTLHIDGAAKTIYDPYSTQFEPATGTVARTPFPGNRIPTNRFDPVAAQIVKDLWGPNNPGENITGLNNFRTSLTRGTDYWNFSDRADWNINSNWRVYGRYSKLHTLVDSTDPTPNKSPWYVTQGASARHALSISGDAVWTLDARTVVNFHGDYHSLVDDYDSPRDKLGKEGWGKIWPHSQWYKPYEDGQPPYVPRLSIGGSQFGVQGVYWYQHPNGNAFNAKISQQRGPHYLKAGFDTRRSGGVSLVTGTTLFNFGSALTADTFISPNTKYVGHEYATFLLGALDTGSLAVVKPIKNPRTEFYSLFLQDDFKLSRRITLNLGLRYEYETPWHDPEHKMSRYLDLTQAIPEIQANPPRIPATVTAIARIPYQWNGAWIFSDEKHAGIWQGHRTVFMPRAGFALRLDDRTSLRFGYARYVLPTEYNFIDAPFSGFENINFLEPPYLGFDASQNPAPVLQGVPQARVYEPFPASNPLLPPRGKGFGRYLGLGGENLLWFYQNASRGVNDRFNLSVQRQLPNQIVVDLTLFANYGHNLPWSNNLNQSDPRLSYEHKAALAATVPNPFFQYLTPDQFPGPLRNQRNVTIGSLLRPYPQYGGLWEINTPGRLERYRSVQIKVQRAFRNGYNFLFGYVYHRERSYEYFNDIATYLKQFTYQESNMPRHRIATAGTYELPFGKNRKYLSALHPVLNGVLGGWQIVGAWYFNSGDYLRFGSMIAEGNPKIGNPTPKRWFDTSKFQKQPPYTVRTNPKQYSGLTGPLFWDLEGTLSKTFPVTERVRTEFKVAGYNVTNRLNWANPSTDVLSSTFGQTLRQRTTNGRQLEFGLKILF